MVSWKAPFNVLDRIMTWLATLLLGVGVAFMCLEIFIRYFFGVAHDWGDAMIQAGVVCGYLLVAGPVIRKDSHSRIETLVVSLKEKKRKVMELFLAIVTLLFLIFLFVSSIKIVQSLKKFQLVEPTTLYTPSWLIYLPLPIGVGGCIIFAVEKVADRILSLIRLPSK